MYEVASDGEDYRRYVRGEPGPDLARKGPWLERLRREAAAGIRNQRVHIMRSPLTDYLRYECEWGYVPNAAALADLDDRAGRFLGATPVDGRLVAGYQAARGVAEVSPEAADS